MKIAILTSGILPVPAVLGGAVENLTDFYLDYNNRHHLHDITVYSVAHPNASQHPALKSDVNHYHYIDIGSFWSKVRKHIYQFLHGQEYFHYTIEYYMEQAMKDILRQGDFDLIIIENRPAYSLKLASRTKAKLVCHLHNDFLNSETKEAQSIYDALSRIITVSDYIGKRVKTIDPDSSKCITVNNGIDLSAFSQPKVPSPTRSDLGLLPTDFVLIYSGRINSEKGIAELIQSMALLKGNSDIKLLVMGGSFFGDDHTDNPFISKLKSWAGALDGRIKFTGFIPYDRLPGYLQLADVAIIPSQWEEPFGLTCLEAMATGKPIIATKRGGIPEILHDSYAIMLPTGPEFIAQLASSILELYHHPEKCVTMGLAAREASQQYDKDRYAQEFFQTLKF